MPPRPSGLCCGPRRLHPVFQVFAYIVFALMILLTIWQLLQLVGGSLANCAEKPEWCNVGTVRNANLRYVGATIPYFFFNAIVILPLIIFWRPERAFASAAISGILFVFSILLLIIDIHVLAANIPTKRLVENPGLSSFIAGTVILGIHFFLSTLAWILEMMKPKPYEATLLVNNL